MFEVKKSLGIFTPNPYTRASVLGVKIPRLFFYLKNHSEYKAIKWYREETTQIPGTGVISGLPQILGIFTPNPCTWTSVQELGTLRFTP